MKKTAGRPVVTNEKIILNEDQKEIALNTYQTAGTLLAVSNKLNEAGLSISRATLSSIMKRDRTFGRAMENAKTLYIEYLEGILNDRLTDGTDKYGTLLIFSLKAHDPKKYRDQVSTVHSGTIDIKVMSAVPRPPKLSVEKPKQIEESFGNTLS